MARPVLSLSLWLSLWVRLCQQQMSADFGGPFRIVPYQIEQCDDIGTNEIFFSSTRISKVSRTKYVYSSNFTANIPFSDELECEVDVAVWGNGGWRPHYVQETVENVCSALQMFMPELFKELVAKMDMKCPLPPGTYELKELDLSKMQLGSSLPSMQYGKYRADSSARKNGTLVGCFRIYVDVVPRKPQRPSRKKTSNFH